MNYLTSEHNNPVDNLIEIYNSEYCITLDELPDLKSYPIDTEGTSTGTGSTSEYEDVLWGDANCDGEVNMADAVLVMQYLANPDTYGLNKPDGITEKGKANADVASHGDGITNNDALEIQSYKLGIIDNFNI